MEDGTGGIEPGKVVLGMRAGFAPLDPIVERSISTDVGSLVNFQGMYSLNKWLLVGMMLEWERHTMSPRGSGTDFGHQDTVSVLPTVEVRPVKFGPVIPYANMSFGVNVNSFGENIGDSISPSNTFAWRLGWGADYMLTKQFALNTEMAYKRNDGHATINGSSRERLERLFFRLPLRRQTFLLVSEYSKEDVVTWNPAFLWRVPHQIGLMGRETYDCSGSEKSLTYATCRPCFDRLHTIPVCSFELKPSFS